MKHFKYFLIILPVILVLGGCFLFPQEEKIIPPPLIEPEEITYQTMEVQTGTIKSVLRGNATFQPVEKYRYYYERPVGRLDAILVNVGDQIYAGQELVRVRTGSLEDDIRQQEIIVEKQRLVLENMREQAGSDSNVLVAELNVNTAKLSLDELKDELSQLQKILEVDPSVKDQIKSIQNRIKHQEISLQKAEISLENEKIRKNNTTSIRIQELDLEASQMKLNNLKSQMTESTLTASKPGYVNYVNYNIQPGEPVSAFNTLVEVSNTRDLQLEYQGVNSNLLPLGRTVTISFSRKEYTAEVVMNPSSMPIDVPEREKDKVRFDMKKLPPGAEIGQMVSWEYVAEKAENTIVVPRKVVHEYQGTSYVFVLENDIKTRRDVQIGISTPTEVQIIKGLEAGELVVMD
jgi:macrolide-specific efflux system membrane fusion protein